VNVTALRERILKRWAPHIYERVDQGTLVTIAIDECSTAALLNIKVADQTPTNTAMLKLLYDFKEYLLNSRASRAVVESWTKRINAVVAQLQQ
jgi:hypothetical protein